MSMSIFAWTRASPLGSIIVYLAREAPRKGSQAPTFFPRRYLHRAAYRPPSHSPSHSPIPSTSRSFSNSSGSFSSRILEAGFTATSNALLQRFRTIRPIADCGIPRDRTPHLRRASNQLPSPFSLLGLSKGKPFARI
jgi:hypothetical protein